MAIVGDTFCAEIYFTFNISISNMIDPSKATIETFLASTLYNVANALFTVSINIFCSEESNCENVYPFNVSVIDKNWVTLSTVCSVSWVVTSTLLIFVSFKTSNPLSATVSFSNSAIIST